MSNWKLLLEEIKKNQQQTENKKPLINALDCLSDQIKSGEEIPNEFLESVIETLIKSLTFSNWNMNQTIFSIFCHVIIQAGKDRIVNFVSKFEKKEENSIENISKKNDILSVIFETILSDKRELRDISAQTLGSLSSVLNDQAFILVHDFLQTYSKSSNWQILEGIAMAIGYMVSRCKTISLQNFQEIFEILSSLTQFQAAANYSSYVRLAALKAFNKIIRSESIYKLQSTNQFSEFAGKIKEIFLTEINDDEINTRKQAAFLSSGLVLLQMSTLESDELKTKFVTETINELLGLANKITRWECLHGVCLSLTNLFSNQQCFLSITYDPNILKIVIETLEKFIQNQHSNEKRKNINMDTMGNSNNSALVALVNIFLGIFHLETEKNDLSKLMENLSLKESASSQFLSKHIIPQIDYLLETPFCKLIDGAESAVEILIKNAPIYMHPHISGVLVKIFKNMFHSSLPVRDAAIRAWRLGVANLKGIELIITKNSNVFDSHHLDFLLENSTEIIEKLRIDSRNNSYEVREAVYRGVAHLLSYLSNNKLFHDPNVVIKLVDILVYGSLDKTGKLSEFSRLAAIYALASFLDSSVYFDIFSSVQIFVDFVSQKIVPVIFQLLSSEEEEEIIGFSLDVVSAFSSKWSSIIQSTNTLFTPILILTNSPNENIRFHAFSSRSALVGNFSQALKQTPNFIESLINGFSGRFSLDPIDNPFEENRIAVARTISEIIVSKDFQEILFQTSSLLSKFINIIVQAYLNPENSQSKEMKMILIGIIYVVLFCLDEKSIDIIDPQIEELIDFVCSQDFWLSDSNENNENDPYANFDDDDNDNDNDNDDNDNDNDNNSTPFEQEILVVLEILLHLSNKFNNKKYSQKLSEFYTLFSKQFQKESNDNFLHQILTSKLKPNFQNINIISFIEGFITKNPSEIQPNIFQDLISIFSALQNSICDQNSSLKLTQFLLNIMEIKIQEKQFHESIIISFEIINRLLDKQIAKQIIPQIMNLFSKIKNLSESNENDDFSDEEIQDEFWIEKFGNFSFWIYCKSPFDHFSQKILLKTWELIDDTLQKKLVGFLLRKLELNQYLEKEIIDDNFQIETILEQKNFVELFQVFSLNFKNFNKDFISKLFSAIFEKKIKLINQENLEEMNVENWFEILINISRSDLKIRIEKELEFLGSLTSQKYFIEFSEGKLVVLVCLLCAEILRYSSIENDKEIVIDLIYSTLKRVFDGEDMIKFALERMCLFDKKGKVYFGIRDEKEKGKYNEGFSDNQ
ncbi:cysteine and glycine-rich protein 2 binding protein [Anaeramoeba ignava]|uniref:Cysteine and glycine-rich protein 2 binding protein n=1 Tax=Anaeramoeba ignava TaxID=1746090 RepID=A0A9Q0LXM1_ANAIG|nr:cysteine and glycine-rich protein 2 binding protein [Anaeramoeba ignava]